MNTEHAKQAEPATLNIAVNELMEEVMNSSEISVQKSSKIIKILQRIDNKPSGKQKDPEQVDVKQPSFIDLINKATSTIRTNRVQTLDNLEKIEAILK